MAHLNKLIRIAGLGLALASGLAAQDNTGFAFRMGGGPVDGGVRKMLGDAGYSFAGSFEYAWKLQSDSALVATAGFRFYPGDFKTVSYIPSTLPVRATPGTYHERAQVDKGEAQSVELSALYRKDAFSEGMYWQAGLVLSVNKVEMTSTGTDLTIVTTAPNTAGSVTAATTIADRTSKSAAALNVTGGVGMRFGARYALEANAFTTRLESSTVKKSGFGTDLTFSVRF